MLRRDRAIIEGVKDDITHELKKHGPLPKGRLISLTGEPRDVVFRALRQLVAEGRVIIEQVPKGGPYANGAFGYYDLVTLTAKGATA